MSTPTLIEDLEFAAGHFEGISRDMPPIKPMRADTAARAARLREHARRLREEMASREWLLDMAIRDGDEAGRHTNLAVKAALNRINNGPEDVDHG